ncbi:hypothetical protein [Ideonella sp.]|uniref:hypothetical protein n=1 Tax=Ideonella sp. TaxID=1929293 RepID=UPI0035AEB7EA
MDSARLTLNTALSAHRVAEAPAATAGHAAYLLLLIGALMVLVTCVGYALAGPLAAMPAGAASFDAARAATPAAAGWMLLASWAGMPGDVVLAVAGLMLAQRRGQPAQTAAGWYALAIVGLVFLVVDTLVGQVLPPLALGGPDAAAAYAGARALFDALFHMGTFVGGLSGLALAWAPGGRPRGWGPLMGLAGMLGVVAGGAGLMGWGLPQATGGAVTLLVLALAGWGWVGWRDRR